MTTVDRRRYIDLATPHMLKTSFFQLWCLPHSKYYSSYTRGVKIKNSAESRLPRAKPRGVMVAQWPFVHFRTGRKRYCEHALRAHKVAKVGAEDGTFKLRTESKLCFCVLPGSPRSFPEPSQRTKVLRTISIAEPSWIKRITHFSIVVKTINATKRTTQFTLQVPLEDHAGMVFETSPIMAKSLAQSLVGAHNIVE